MACKLDFSDVPEIMEDINSQWANYAANARRAKHLATLAGLRLTLQGCSWSHSTVAGSAAGLRWPCRDPFCVPLPHTIPEGLAEPVTLFNGATIRTSR